MTLSLTRFVAPEKEGEDSICYFWTPDPKAAKPIYVPILTIQLVETKGSRRVKVLSDACDDILVLRKELCLKDSRPIFEDGVTALRSVRDAVVRAAIEEGRRKATNT